MSSTRPSPRRTSSFVHPNYLGVEHLVAAVEQLQRLAGAHAQHAADVVGGVLAEGDLRPIGQRLRMVNAGMRMGSLILTKRRRGLAAP